MEMNKTKAKAMNDFFEMISKSWSWSKMTDQERKKFIEYSNLPDYIPSGTYLQVYKTMQNYYEFYTMNMELEKR